MLYIGHFSFDEIGENKENRHGYFTCMVDSKDVVNAVESFKSLIEGMKSRNDHFAGVTDVYVEDIFEIKKMPESVAMIRLQSADGEFPLSVSRSLPIVGNADITAYGWESDVRKIENSGKDQVLEMEPFLNLG